jgi:predicted amidophosphoribosyltransferase
MLFFTLASNIVPGYLENPKIDFQDMLEALDSTQLCPDCNVIRTSRSRHCSVCNHCVERFDHHCPWINNCVGLRNHNYFLLYVFFQLAAVMMALF